jgi:hypothetical protein
MHFAWLKYFTYNLVPVLASNCKQHILSPAEVRKVCYSLAELQAYIKSIWIYSGGGGAAFMKHCDGGASYKSLETYELYSLLQFNFFDVAAVNTKISWFWRVQQ